MKFITEIDNSKEIENLFQSEKTIKCAVAFWGEAAWNLLKNSKSVIKIICNLESGATNPYVIAKLLDKPNIKIKSHPKLHSKIFLVPQEKAIVGSSNVSANGLGYEDEEVFGWVEASILIERENILILEDIDNWFEKKWEQLDDVNQAALDEALEKWTIIRNKRPPITNNNNSLLTELKVNPNAFKHRNIYFAIYRNKGTKEGESKFNEVKNELNTPEQIGYLENWNNLPEDSLHIGLYYGPRSGFEFDGIWKMPSPKIVEKFIHKDGAPGEISICFRVGSIMGSRITDNDLKLLRNKISSLWESRSPKSKDDAVVISLYDAWKFFFNEA
jgi:hypothetical protein